MNIEFIDWHGGEMPVKKGTKVVVVHRDGEIHTDEAGNDYAREWSHCDARGDIIAYRIVNNIPTRSPK